MADKRYFLAITTARPASYLARKYGFRSLAELASNIPKNGKVLDVGAGASPLGQEVTLLRPDIEWFNFDYSYQDQKILSDLIKGSPENLKYVYGDVTELDKYFQPQTFDLVFSYWLLPHLSLYKDKPALRAAEQLYVVAKNNAVLFIGPVAGRTLISYFKCGAGLRVVKNASLSSKTYSKMVVSKTKLSAFNRLVQSTANEVATPYFGTTRYAKSKGRIPYIYDRKNNSYIYPLKPRSLKILFILALKATKHMLLKQFNFRREHR